MDAVQLQRATCGMTGSMYQTTCDKQHVTEKMQKTTADP
jgi:hypothetical protein